MCKAWYINKQMQVFCGLFHLWLNLTSVSFCASKGMLLSKKLQMKMKVDQG